MASTPGERLRFGIALDPYAEDAAALRAAVAAADEHGLDLVGVQDHPYVPRFLDAIALIGVLLGASERVSFFPDVANVALRPPAMLAKATASLRALSGGRFELAIGAGASWDRIEAWGGPRRSGPESVDALVEGVEVLRAMLDGDEPATVDGRFYAVREATAGAGAGGRCPIWLGAVGPRMQRLTGAISDGWAAPIPKYLAYEDQPAALERIDAGAREAGRDPREVRRMAQMPGRIDPGGDPAATPHGDADLVAPADRWAEAIAGFVAERGFDTFVLWPRGDYAAQVELLMREVAPAVRERVGG